MNRIMYYYFYFCIIHFLLIIYASDSNETLMGHAYDTEVVRKKFGSLIALLKTTNNKEVTRCPNPSFMMPLCTTVIPGLERDLRSVDDDKYIVAKSVSKLRSNIEKLTLERYNRTGLYKYGLYPYLETTPFLERHNIFAQEIAKTKPKKIFDIGAYYTPMILFIDNYCPEEITILEPILDPVSATIPCRVKTNKINVNKKLLVHIMPIGFAAYYKSLVNYKRMKADKSHDKNTHTNPDAVICLGCDHHYGPSRSHLEHAFERPYTLFLEFPARYRGSPYVNMGKGRDDQSKGLHLKMEKTLHLNYNISTFTYVDRSMRIIHMV